MEAFLEIGLWVLCLVLLMLSIYIFYTFVRRYMTVGRMPWKWFLLSLFFVPVFCGSILCLQHLENTPPVPIDWGAADTYIGLVLCALLCLFSFWLLSNMYDFTLNALTHGVDPLEKKNWHRKGLFFVCYLDGPAPRMTHEQRIKEFDSKELARFLYRVNHSNQKALNEKEILDYLQQAVEEA